MAAVMLIGFDKSSERRMARIFASVKVNTEAAGSLESALDRMAVQAPGLVVIEKPETNEALHALRQHLLTVAPTTPFLVAMKSASALDALAAMRAGAYDCVAEPYDRNQVLAAAKRAAWRQGRTLFVQKIVQRRRRSGPVALAVLSTVIAALVVGRVWNGPPAERLFLGSANLAGFQWDGRRLWVGDWVEATVTEYRLKKGFLPRYRTLETERIFRLQEGLPILVCNRPDALITVGSDLKIRSHQRSVGLPAMQTYATPGSNPTGLAWDGRDTWSSDGGTGLLYRHGPDFRVVDSVKSILPQVQGLACDGRRLWVVGGQPLKAAVYERRTVGGVWKGPYLLSDLLMEGVKPSGLSIGFERLWLIAGGDPNAVSRRVSGLGRRHSVWDAVRRTAEVARAN